MKDNQSKQGRSSSDGRKNNGQDRCRDENGRFESCDSNSGSSSSMKKSSSSQGRSSSSQGRSSSSQERCRDENGRFESCDR